MPDAQAAPVTVAPPTVESGRLPGGFAPLWTLDNAAAFLGKSRRWIVYALRTPDAEPGSIPHVRLGRTPRFVPDTLAAWVKAGCPPAAVFRAWQDSEEKRRKRA